MGEPLIPLCLYVVHTELLYGCSEHPKEMSSWLLTASHSIKWIYQDSGGFPDPNLPGELQDPISL